MPHTTSSGDDHLLASHTEIRHLNDYDNKAFQHTITDPDDLNAIFVADRTCRHHGKRQRHNATQTPDLGFPSWKQHHHGAALECYCYCCYCCHCHHHPHHHCHCTPESSVVPKNQRQLHHHQQRKRIVTKRLPELTLGKQQQLPPESSQSLSSTDDKDFGHGQLHHIHRHPQRYHKSRLPEKIPTGGQIAIEIDAATLTDDISYCSSSSNPSFALANDTTNSKDILVHCSGDNHHAHPNKQHHHPRRRSKSNINYEQSSRIDSVCSIASVTTTTDGSNGEPIVPQKCKRLPLRKGKTFTRQDTLDGAADVEEEDDDEEDTARPCCDANCCKFSVNESVKIKRKQFINLSKNNYCSSCSKCSSCSCCPQEFDDQLQKTCSFSSSLSHMEDNDEGDDEVCLHCDSKASQDADSDDAGRSSSHQSTESFCSCNSTSRCYCSCSCDESDTIQKNSSTTTPGTMSDVSTPVEAPFDKNNGEDAFSMAGKSSVSQSEYFSLSSDKVPSHSVDSSPASPPVSVMPSPPAIPRKQCKHYSKHHRHKSDGNFDSVL